MKKVFLCLFFMFFVSTGFGQANSKLDSLKRVLAKLPAEGRSFGDDTLRVKVLCEIGKMTKDKDQALQILNNSLVLSKKAKWEKGIAISNNYTGYKYFEKGLNFKAIEFLFKGLHIGENLKDRSIVSYSCRYIADNYSLLKDFENAIKFYNSALNVLDRSSKSYLNCLNNLGLVYYQKEEYFKAIQIFQSCLVRNKKSKNPFLEFYCISNICSSYRKANKLDSALKYSNISLKLINEVKGLSSDDKALTLTEITQIYFARKDFKSAVFYASLANKLYEESNAFTQRNINEMLYTINKHKGNFSEALNNLERFLILRDSTEKQDYQKRLENLKFEYDNQKKQSTILLLNQDASRKQLVLKFLILGLAIFLIFILIQFWFNRLLSRKNNQIEMQKKQIEDFNKNLELKVWQRTEELSQVNRELVLKNFEITEALFKGQTIERKRVAAELHDNLGSTLSAIKWRLGALDSENLNQKEKGIYESIKAMMGNAYNDVRNISHNLLPAEFEEKGLIGALEKMIKDINQSEKIQIKFNNDIGIKNIGKKLALEIYSICLELFNNILKHSNATQASISISLKNSIVKIIINDNGIGINNSTLKNGMGIKNINKRIESINGTVVWNLKNLNGVNVVIQIPQKT